MKKILALILAVFMILTVVACGDSNVTTTTENPKETTTAEETTTEAPTETTTEAPAETTTAAPAVCEHVYEETVLTSADYKNPGEKELKCSACGETKKEEIPVKRDIKILAIGNSFSVDAMEYLWDIFEDAGFDDIVLGNLYIGGCSLDTHWSNIQSGAKAYTYYKNDFGSWSQNKNCALLPALEDEDWDIITIQQVSQNSGMPETFGNLQNIIDYVNEKKTNKDAKLYWHMTWAYQADSSHSGFANYNRDQMTMYNAITSGAQNSILTNDAFTDIIPSGTTVQNLRTSYIGDALTRDGYHMSYDVGRYATALTWFAKLTGLPVDDITYVPKKYSAAITPHMDLIKEAVTAAVAEPFAVTNMTAEKEIVPVQTVEMTEADREILSGLKYDPDDYLVLDVDMTIAAYYNSTGGAELITSGNSTASNIPFFAASRIFTKEELPNGSVIVIDSGYQYRPEGWVSLTSKNASSARPANVTTYSVVVNDAWWGNFEFRAFNLSYIGSKTNVSESDLAHFHIYIPKA